MPAIARKFHVFRRMIRGIVAWKSILDEIALQIHPQVRWRCDVAGIKTGIRVRDQEVHEPGADLVTRFTSIL